MLVVLLSSAAEAEYVHAPLHVGVSLDVVVGPLVSRLLSSI